MRPGDTFRFLRRFLRNPATVGSVTPSSRFLARAMVEDVRLRPGTPLVEFGPGTGPITDEIARVLPSPSAFLGIERDAAFVGMLQKRFPHLRFHCGLAQDVEEILAADPGGPVAAIISGLPFASFPEQLQDAVISAIAAVLEPG